MTLDELQQEIANTHETFGQAERKDLFLAFVAYHVRLFAAQGAPPVSLPTPTPTSTTFTCPSCRYTGTATLA